MKLIKEDIAGADGDKLSYRALAKQLANSIQLTDSPFVYGIYGTWGSGKSTLLTYIAEELDFLHAAADDEKYHFVYFNCWRHSLHNLVLPAFYKILSDTLEDDNVIKFDNAFKDEHLAALSALADASVDIINLADVLDPTPTTKIGRAAAKGISSFLRGRQKRLRDLLNLETKIKSNFYNLCNLLNKNGYTIYVFIDELDRCSPPTVVKMIESLRHLFGVPDTVERRILEMNATQISSINVPIKYIVTMDHEYVANCFSKSYELSELEGSEYIRKFVDHSFSLPNSNFSAIISGVLTQLSVQVRDQATANEFNSMITCSSVITTRDIRQISEVYAGWVSQVKEIAKIDLSQAAGPGRAGQILLWSLSICKRINADLFSRLLSPGNIHGFATALTNRNIPQHITEHIKTNSDLGAQSSINSDPQNMIRIKECQKILGRCQEHFQQFATDTNKNAETVQWIRSLLTSTVG